MNIIDFQWSYGIVIAFKDCFNLTRGIFIFILGGYGSTYDYFMRKYLIAGIVCCIALTDLYGQGSKNQEPQPQYTPEERQELITSFRRALQDARNRIDRLQENAPLRREVTYEEEEEFLRKARQMLGLMEEGNYIERAELKEMERQLNQLGNQGQVNKRGNSQADRKRQDKASRPISRLKGEKINQLNQSLRRSGETAASGDEVVKSSRQKIKDARQRLDRQRKSGRISENEYQARLNRIKLAEQKIDNLEEKIRLERQKITKIREDIESGP